MSFEMVNADDGLAERARERARHARSDEQRAGKARALRVGNAIEIVQSQVRLRKNPLGERHDAPNVIARREFGHDAAVRLMHRDLRMERMRQQTARAVVHGNAGFVAGSLEAEDTHG